MPRTAAPSPWFRPVRSARAAVVRRVLIAVLLAGLAGLPGLTGAGAALAQDREETLADIRQQLSVLYVELQRLKRELNTTGGVGGMAAGGSVIERVNAIESELQRLTAKTEELEFRIDSIAEDGGNRLGDLEFRLCELESGCDVSTLGQGTTLGGGALSGTGLSTGLGGGTGGGTDGGGTDAGTGSVQMAVGEQADFDLAMQALDAGDHATAAERFAQFRLAYPGSPLEAEAGLRRGEALEASGQMAPAARAYLDTFSTSPNGPKAPEALFRLGWALGRLGQTGEACVTLSEVEARFPGGQPAADARAEMQALGCQ